MSKKQTTKPSNKAPKALIESILEESIRIRQKILSDKKIYSEIIAAVEMMVKCIKSGGTIFACGNGGSSNDAMHFVEELVARYKRERRGIKAMHFMDPAVLTCWSNDYDYATAFERQAQTFCGKNDILLAISTSGNSANVNKAVAVCKKNKAKTIALTGKDGGTLKNLADICFVVPANETERIQEVHITLIHIFCELIETHPSFV